MSERIVIDMSTFGKRLRIARRAVGVSMRALAGRVGVSHNAISKYEHDAAMPSAKTLMALKRELGVSMDFLMAGNAHTIEIVSICMQKDVMR